MATKKELQAQANDAGVEYDPKATKGDLEQVLADAGVEVVEPAGSDREWFKTKATGAVFSAVKGTPLHKRVTSPKSKHLYEPTSKPARKSKG